MTSIENIQVDISNPDIIPQKENNLVEPWKYAVAGTAPAKNLTLQPVDEKARANAPSQPGYCVDELCVCDRHQCIPSKAPIPFNSTSTYRTEYVNKLQEDINAKKLASRYGPDGVPIGVDPKVWADYIEKHGKPPFGVIPSHLYYTPKPELRDFSTESRTQFTSKHIAAPPCGVQFGPDGVPIGVDKKRWEKFIKEHGVPLPHEIPAYLFYKSAPETRDFATIHRSAFQSHSLDICPVTRLPRYPVPKWPRQHTFWDPVAKQWY